MKKTLLVLFLILSMAPAAQAVTFYSTQHSLIKKNATRNLYPIVITAEADAEITAEHGIDLTLDAEAEILWDRQSTIYATGSAVNSGKISDEITPEYRNDYKVIHIPVEADFETGESITVHGIYVRAYQTRIRETFISIDLNGDGVFEAVDINKIEVISDTATDLTPPYPPKSLSAIVSGDLSMVTITWEYAPDYDNRGMSLIRTLERDGKITENTFFENRYVVEYEDTDVQEGDKITYVVYARDEKNVGESAEVTIEVVAPPVLPEPEPEPPVVVTPPPTEPTDSELINLNKLYFYYQVRHNIKCIGVNSNPTSSACLWAKIDLVYTQELTGQSEVDESLSEHDLYLMALRVKWPEMRYQDKCVDADVPDKICNALEQSLKRIHHFID